MSRQVSKANGSRTGKPRLRFAGRLRERPDSAPEKALAPAAGRSSPALRPLQGSLTARPFAGGGGCEPSFGVSRYLLTACPIRPNQLSRPYPSHTCQAPTFIPQGAATNLWFCYALAYTQTGRCAAQRCVSAPYARVARAATDWKATAIDNLHTLTEERLDEVIAEVRANRDILERLEKQGHANALAIAELKGIRMASAPESGLAPGLMEGG